MQKILAKKLLKEFGDLNSLINNIENDFFLKFKINKKIYTTFLLIKELIKRVLLHKVVKQNILSSFKELVDYLKFSMMALKIEHLRILYLNKKMF